MRWGLARTVGVGLLAVAALAILVPDWLWGPELSLLLAAGVVAYLLIRVVRDDGADHIGRLAARIGIGIVLLALAAGGFTAAAAGSALGGGVVIAGLIVACGVGLVGGAFRGGARWLIAPAIVLALPLAAVAATDLDVRGTWGDRTFRPASVADLDRRIRDGGRRDEGRPARRRAARRPHRPAPRPRHGRDPGARARGHVRDHRREDRRRRDRHRRRRAGRRRPRRRERRARLARHAPSARDRGRRRRRGARRRPRRRLRPTFDGNDMDVRPGTSFAACEGAA